MSARMLGFVVIGLMFTVSNLASGQDKLTKFRFVHLEANGSQAVPFIAKEARVFEKNGLDVEIIRIGGGSRVIQAMLAGEIKVAHGSSPGAVEANLAGADLVVIASTVNVATFRMMAAPTIKAFADLKGKKIAISRFGGQTDALTRYLLDRWKLDARKTWRCYKPAAAPRPRPRWSARRSTRAGQSAAASESGGRGFSHAGQSWAIWECRTRAVPS